MTETEAEGYKEALRWTPWEEARLLDPDGEQNWGGFIRQRNYQPGERHRKVETQFCYRPDEEGLTILDVRHQVIRVKDVSGDKPIYDGSSVVVRYPDSRVQERPFPTDFFVDGDRGPISIEKPENFFAIDQGKTPSED